MARRPLTPEEFQAKLDDAFPNSFETLEFESRHANARFQCRECRHEFVMRANNLLLRGNCPACGRSPGRHTIEQGLQAAQDAAEAYGSELVRYEPNPKPNRRGGRYVFRCHQHGEYTSTRPSRHAQCPRCRGYVSPNDPKLLPARLHRKPCVLYLVEIRDTTGQYFTKVGISTDWKTRKRHYGRAGVTILRELRMYHTTLIDALTIEQSLKRWMRRTLGRRKCPPRRWAGWSESAIDPFRKFPAAFDREVTLHRARRKP